MKSHRLTLALGWFAAVLIYWPTAPYAATYQLQVASVPDQVFMYFVEDRTLTRMETFLDDKQRSRFVLFRDRQPQPVAFMTSEQSAPLAVDAALAKRNDPWGVTTWDSEPGQVALFRVRGKQRSHQKLKQVAVHTGGTLTRLPVRRIPSSQQAPMHVPATTASYVMHVLENGTFLAWAKQRAASFDGLSVIVGRHPDPQQSDTVYLLVHMRQAGQAYKVVMGWENLENEMGHGRVQRRDRR